MTWTHMHPPCDPTTDHANTTVKLDVTWSGGGATCTYQGAATGTGPVCTPK